jgi:hypothetical protein
MGGACCARADRGRSGATERSERAASTRSGDDRAWCVICRRRCTVAHEQVVYFTASSLDGFIADERNSLDWLFETPRGDDESSWDKFIRAVGPMCMGRTTYEWMLQHD